MKTQKRKHLIQKTRKFRKSDYSSGDGFLTSVWGPAAWLFLHTISFNYPVSPTDEQKHQYRNFILSLQHVLPCRHCRENLSSNLKKVPLTMKHMKSRDTFSKYIYRLHEHINKMLGKPSSLKYADIRERYEHLRARCTYEQKVEKGCTRPLYGKKSKCVIKIVPQDSPEQTFSIDKQCLREQK
jgi:hypothetical protein